MTQLDVWRSLFRTSNNWKVVMVALRHIEMLREKEQARKLAQLR